MIKSLAIYFFYDEASIVDEYVFYYLKCLSPCFDEICFVSNSNLDSKVITRLSAYCRKVRTYFLKS